MQSATRWGLVAALVAVPGIAKIRTVRAPNAGIQPQVAVGERGVVHLIYFKGEPAHGDLFYVRSSDNGATFSAPIRVNSVPESAVATGTIRGGQIALGADGTVHVAWNGAARLRGAKGVPMLYARMPAGTRAFEPQRNLMRSTADLDGGGTIAADHAGAVWVAWHGRPASAAKEQGEAGRQVFVAASHDGGKTFAPERPAWKEATGACGCCMLRAFADAKGSLYMLYRSALEQVHRDIYLLESNDAGGTFRGVRVHAWEINACPMSAMSFAETPAVVLAAWETKGQVYWSAIRPGTIEFSAPAAPPGSAKRKYPAIAGNTKGETLLVWAEGTGWGKGGEIAWQVFDHDVGPTAERGQAPGLPAWSLPAVWADAQGNFTIVY